MLSSIVLSWFFLNSFMSKCDLDLLESFYQWLNFMDKFSNVMLCKIDLKDFYGGLKKYFNILILVGHFYIFTPTWHQGSPEINSRKNHYIRHEPGTDKRPVKRVEEKTYTVLLVICELFLGVTFYLFHQMSCWGCLVQWVQYHEQDL